VRDRKYGTFDIAVALAALWVGFGSSSHADPATESPAGEPEVRTAIERSLPFLINGTEAWRARTFGEKKVRCISCHHAPFAVWTQNEAKTRGFAIDQPKLDEMSGWMFGFAADNQYPSEMVDGFLDTLLLVREAGPAPRLEIKTLERFQQLLAEQQRPDGSWMLSDGTTPNEPGFDIVPPDATDKAAAKREANEVDTMWTLLGLDALGRLGDALSPAARAGLGRQRARALAFLQEAQGGSRSDWLAFRMLIERDLGDPAKVDEWRRTLLGRQNEDGGWPLVRGGPSHPLTTGQVLYALGTVGVGADEAAVRQARRFLVTTQRADGSWEAVSRAIADHRNYVTVYFGTGWATLGLLRTLPAPAEAERAED
jgi:hypothetical protein